MLFYVGLLFVISQAAGNMANRINLPRMIGYIAAGIVFGPYVFGWFDQNMIEKDLVFFRDFALAVIAFSIGGTLQMPILRQLRSRLAWITLLQTFGASLCVFLALWWLLPFSAAAPHNSDPNALLIIAIILGAVSAATAPAAILALVDEYEAKGEFKATLLGIVAFDDIIAVLFYTVALAISTSLLHQNNGYLATTLGHTGGLLFTEVALGLLVGFVVAKVLRFFSEYRSMLGVLLGIIMLVCGFCLSVGLSPLLTCMVLGFMVTNLARHDLADEAMDIIHTIQPPVFGVFFFMAGAHLNIFFALSAAGCAIVLTVARFAGKYGGTWLGGRMAGMSNTQTQNLGLSLLPAAGVMVGLAMNAKDSLGAALGSYSDLMIAIVIGATLLNEFLTPFFVRHAIRRQNTA